MSMQYFKKHGSQSVYKIKKKLMTFETLIFSSHFNILNLFIILGHF